MKVFMNVTMLIMSKKAKQKQRKETWSLNTSHVLIRYRGGAVMKKVKSYPHRAPAVMVSECEDVSRRRKARKVKRSEKPTEKCKEFFGIGRCGNDFTSAGPEIDSTTQIWGVFANLGSENTHPG